MTDKAVAMLDRYVWECVEHVRDNLPWWRRLLWPRLTKREMDLAWRAGALMLGGELGMDVLFVEGKDDI